MPPEAREALALRQASNALTGAFTGVVEPDQLSSTVGTAVNTLSRSQVGRLQQAAARIWLLEQAGEPVEKWWPSLRVFFDGMQRANLGHYQRALTQHWARAYESVHLGRGTAYGLAEDLVGHPHGPFLQFFAQRLRRVIDEREQTGDVAAATTCRRVLYRLLRQWVLEPGSVGLRLLAADLLADDLETDPAAAAPKTRVLVQDLRAWRSMYRRAARQRPTAILAPQRKPALAPAAHQRLVSRVGLTTWLGSATVAAGVAALALGWLWLSRGRAAVGGRRLALHAPLVAVLVSGAGVAWILVWPEWIHADLRADFSSFHYWWRHPFVAAGLTLALVIVAGLLPPLVSGGRVQASARLGAIAVETWLMLGVILWCSVTAGEFARRDYERATRAAHQDAFAAIAGPDAERSLARLRRWEP